MIGRLPTSLMVDGQEYRIRSDYRDILRIIEAYNDPELKDSEKAYVCLFILYEDFEEIENIEEAYKQAVWFIGGGRDEGSENSPKTVDWEQDEHLIFSAVNKVAGYEVRAVEYLHWWTFLGYFMEISEGTFAEVVNLRAKRAKGKPLEKWEREFWNENKKICVIRPKMSDDEKELLDLINKELK